MSMKRIAAVLTGTASLTVGLAIAMAPTASAESCYHVGLDHSPSVYYQLFPPQADIDDGGPYAYVDPYCIAN